MQPGHPTVAVVFCTGPRSAWEPTLALLRELAPDLHLVAGGPDLADSSPAVPESDESAGPPRPTTMRVDSLAELVSRARVRHRTHLAIVVPGAELAPGMLESAAALLDSNARLATVSFLSAQDRIGRLILTASTPTPTPPAPSSPASSSPASSGEATRTALQAEPRLDPLPVAYASGPVVVLSRHALSAVGPLSEAEPGSALADFSLRARRRGFLDVRDTSSFVTGPPSTVDVEWLLERHPFAAALLEEDHDAEAAVANVVRSKVRGLDVIIDASWSGPWEMGTQVQALALVQALSRRADVRRVTVALPREPSPMASALESETKVVAHPMPYGEVAGLGPADVIHRPFQPDWPLDIDVWRDEATCTVVTLLDLISWTVGTYHASGDEWMAYRRTIRDTAARVDGMVAISDDVASQARMERLPVEPSRLFVVPLGTDHLQGDESELAPEAALTAGLGERFCLVLGADYTHKNRDLAVRAHAELRRRGFDIDLVLAGPTVRYGSSRMTEAVAGAATRHDRIFVLGSVVAAERNWLLRHAEVVLYPTSAEGFGLVPYEAAAFGTPTVLVPSGPLTDLASALPVAASGWSPVELAAAAEQLLVDRDLAGEQVKSALVAGRHLTWDACAARLVMVYRELLALPRRTI